MAEGWRLFFIEGWLILSLLGSERDCLLFSILVHWILLQYPQTAIQYIYKLKIRILKKFREYCKLQMKLILIFPYIFISFFLLILLFTLVPINCVYDVPSYYGHFSLNFYKPQYIRSGTFRYFQYHYSFTMDNNNKTIYYANTKQNCIQKYNLQTKRKTILAGICGQSGNRIGGLSVMLLNNPMSVVFYQANNIAIESQNNMKMYIVNNSTCNLYDSDCNITNSNSNVVKNMNLNINNLRPFPQIIQFPPLNNSEPMYLFVSDTNNHCIKKIDLFFKTSTVVAGQCGVSGFLDGPLGLNKLNKPSNLGITKNGQLYFYDLGNQYMRKVHKNGTVSTLKNGACTKLSKSRTVGGYTLNNILCYDNWIQYGTKSPIQHAIDFKEMNICSQHSSKC